MGVWVCACGKVYYFGVLGKFKDKASILHKIARKKGQSEINGIGMCSNGELGNKCVLYYKSIALFQITYSTSVHIFIMNRTAVSLKH